MLVLNLLSFPALMFQSEARRMGRPTEGHLSAVCPAHHLMPQTKHGEQAGELEAATDPITVCRVLTPFRSDVLQIRTRATRQGRQLTSSRSWLRPTPFCQTLRRSASMTWGALRASTPATWRCKWTSAAWVSCARGPGVLGNCATFSAMHGHEGLAAAATCLVLLWCAAM